MDNVSFAIYDKQGHPLVRAALTGASGKGFADTRLHAPPGTLNKQTLCCTEEHADVALSAHYSRLSIRRLPFTTASQSRKRRSHWGLLPVCLRTKEDGKVFLPDYPK